MSEYRILITGSRDWDDRKTVNLAIAGLIKDNQRMSKMTDTEPHVTIVHGDCPTGADDIADEWNKVDGVDAEPHPAKWNVYKKQAGFIRNQEMVDLGAAVCLAFINQCKDKKCKKNIKKEPPHGSHGATHTADAAEAAGITTLRFGFKS